MNDHKEHEDIYIYIYTHTHTHNTYIYYIYINYALQMCTRGYHGKPAKSLFYRSRTLGRNTILTVEKLPPLDV